MGMAQLVTAVLVEGRSKSEVARSYGVTGWVITLVRRFLTEGEPGLQPQSRGPQSSPGRTLQAVEDKIVALRKDSIGTGTRPARRPSPRTCSSATAGWDQRAPAMAGSIKLTPHQISSPTCAPKYSHTFSNELAKVTPCVLLPANKSPTPTLSSVVINEPESPKSLIPVNAYWF